MREARERAVAGKRALLHSNTSVAGKRALLYSNTEVKPRGYLDQEDLSSVVCTLLMCACACTDTARSMRQAEKSVNRPHASYGAPATNGSRYSFALLVTTLTVFVLVKSSKLFA